MKYWNWLKSNWQRWVWVPVLFAFIWISRHFGPRVVDPVLEADRRALEEEKKRLQEHARETAKLKEDLEQIKGDYNRAKKKGEIAVEDTLESLEDPEALVRAMKKVGRGEPL